MWRCTRGQSLLELIMILPVVVLAVTEALSILYATVQRTQCSMAVFEATRTALESQGSRNGKTRVRTTVQSVAGGYRGYRKCGTHLESVFLPNLGERTGASRSD